MRTSTPIALFSFALALYAAPFAHAAAGPSRDVRQLSDQNLFEVHLQKGIAASHKRLPSEVITHHERNEGEEDLVMPVAGSSSSSSSSSVETPATASTASRDGARQPSHFIKHFKHRANKLGKRRLSDSQTTFRFERDSDDLDSSIWDVPALVARVIDDTKSGLFNAAIQPSTLAAPVHASEAQQAQIPSPSSS